MSKSITTNIVKIVVWSVIGIAAILAMVQFSSGRWAIAGWFHAGGTPEHVIREETVREDIRDIDIDWASGDLFIVSGDKDEIAIVEKAVKPDEESNLVTTVNDGRLSIESDRKSAFSFLWWGWRGTRLEITLPKQMYDRIAIDATSGDCALSDMKIGSLTMELTSGDLRLDEVSAERMDVTLTSGSLNGERLEADGLDVRMTSGDVDLSGGFSSIDLKVTSGESFISSTVLPEHLEADMTSGSMVFALPENEGFSVLIKITSGEFESDFDMRSSGDVYTHKAGGPSYRLSCTSGDMRIQNLK